MSDNNDDFTPQNNDENIDRDNTATTLENADTVEADLLESFGSSSSVGNYSNDSTSDGVAYAETQLRSTSETPRRNFTMQSDFTPSSQLSDRNNGTDISLGFGANNQTPLHSQSSLRSQLPRNLVGTPFSNQSRDGVNHNQHGHDSTPRSMSSNISRQSQSPLPRSDMGRSSTNYQRTRVLPVPQTPLTPMSQLGSANNDYENESIGDNRYGEDGEDGEADTVDGRMEGEREHLDNTMIWGTSININNCINLFKRFILGFRLEANTVNDDNDRLEEFSFYQKELYIMHRTGSTLLNLNCAHLRQYRPTRSLYDQLCEYPQEIIPLMDQVIQDEYVRTYGEQQVRLQIRTHGLAKLSKMRQLDPQNIDQLVMIKGMIVRCSSIIPDLKQAFFRCFACSYSLEVLIDRGRIEEPQKCPQCSRNASMEIINNRSLFSDKQLIRMQETNEDIPEGETPYTLTLFAYDDLVDALRPGDRVEMTGIFRAVPKRANPRVRSVKSIYKTYVDAIHFKRDDQGKATSVISSGLPTGTLNSDREEGNEDITLNYNSGFSEERLASFKSLVRESDVYDRLVRSFAPSIWGLEDVKRGLLCLLVGGSRQVQEDEVDRYNHEGDHGNVMLERYINEDRTVRQKQTNQNKGNRKMHQRGDINILLCGDPGTSKSQLLSYVNKISPRGIYTSGKGSSAVGLTASVVRDPETRDMVLESGALVLSDNGICCIDEFDKMSDTTRAILHEAMEQQTVSITKAGIIATLNARTAILASANPAESRYNPSLSVVENLQQSAPLLSRFDLIYLVLDKPDADTDRRLANHIVALYQNVTGEDLDVISNNERGDVIDQSLLRDFIMYARNFVFPEITDETGERLVEVYLEMRAAGGRGTKTIGATPRALESLIRISQALAKMRLAREVSIGDVEEATRLVKVSTQTAAVNPRTGIIDMDIISTGRNSFDVMVIQTLADEIKNSFCRTSGERMTLGHIRQVINGREGAKKVTLQEVKEAVKVLDHQNTLKFISRTQTVIVH